MRTGLESPSGILLLFASLTRRVCVPRTLAELLDHAHGAARFEGLGFGGLGICLSAVEDLHTARHLAA